MYQFTFLQLFITRATHNDQHCAVNSLLLSPSTNTLQPTTNGLPSIMSLLHYSQ